jgi:exopolyphosphatase/pppGpp-phosphohydrolase
MSYQFIYSKIILVLILFVSNGNSQNNDLFGGIEIGGKGIKMTVINVNNIKKSDYTVVSNWTENVGIAQGISVDGKLRPQDIELSASVVKKNLSKLINEFKVPESNVYVVGSSGVAMASNTQDLVEKVKLLTNKRMEFITVETEAKMLMKGCINSKDYEDALIIDIGGGNTKGGYVTSDAAGKLIFHPISMDYGTVTLTKSLETKLRTNTIDEYNEKSFGELPILRKNIDQMYAPNNKGALNKKKVYLSGGAAWAFFTIYKGKTEETYSPFNLTDVIYYDAILKNNFRKIQDQAANDNEVATVLKVYSQEYLISGSNILLSCLEVLPNIEDKKLYFAKEGQIAWLVSYIVDKSDKKFNKIE